MHIFCSKTEFSMNKIGDALREIAQRPPILLADEFGGRGSIAFRERLVNEYNESQPPVCPLCDIPLRFIEPEVAECPRCGNQCEFPDYDKDKCVISEKGVAEFVARQIAHGWARRTGDHYHLGEVRGRTLFYGTNPGKYFYTSHRGDVGIVLGSNDAGVPEWWNGHVAHLSELFYVDEPTNVIRVARDIAKDLLPPEKRHEKLAGSRMIHERRSEWLMFISHLFSKPLNPKDFCNGRIRPRVACDWFMKHYPGTAPTSSKQYQRDLYAFRHLGKDPTKPDKRERFIVLLLRWAADKKYTNEERMSIAKLITELVLYLQEGAEKNHGHPIEITRSVWQHCKDGTKERVAVTDIDKFFDQLDERLARSA